MATFLYAISALAAAIPASSSLIQRAAATDATSFSAQSFDYIVVGAGTAGLAVASKLAADGTTKVGIIEAGEYLPNDPLIDVPKNFGLNNGNPKYDWRFNTTPQVQLGNRTVPHPRGKVVGGSTALNYLVFNRGAKVEYDAWAEIGNDGWDWAGVLPSFRSSYNYTALTEGQEVGSGFNASSENSQDVGSGGVIQATYNTYYTDLNEPYVEAMKSLNISTNNSPDSGNPLGIYNTPTSVDHKTGKRSYAAAYYAANLDKSNFVVLTGAHATKINFSPDKRDGKVVASGVTFQINGTSYVVNASKEVILSAGVFQSPQLLELSGIGNATLLQSYGIASVIDLPGVGENLQDHAMSGQLWQVNPGVETWDQLRINQTFAGEAARQYNTTHDGPLSSTISTLAFTSFKATTSGNDTAYQDMLTTLDTWLNSTTLTPLQKKQYDIQKRWMNEETAPGMEFVMVPMGGLTRTRPANETSYLVVSAILQHPFSRGSVHITSNDPLQLPAVDPRYLSSPFDTAALVQGVAFANKLVSTAPLSNLITTRIDPATNFTTSQHFEQYVRASLQSIKHPVGTCAMAPQNLNGVVDSSLKVWGSANIRVVDASIVPQHIAAHMQSTVYAIGEKAGDIIKSGSSTGNANGSRGGNVYGWLSLTVLLGVVVALLASV